MHCQGFWRPTPPTFLSSYGETCWKKKNSVHQSGWPEPGPTDQKIEQGMNSTREITQALLSIREKIQRGVRWPIKEAFVISDDESAGFACEQAGHLIKQQANLKKLSLQTEFKEAKKQLKPDYAKMGPVFGKDTPKIIAGINMQGADSVLKLLEEKGEASIEADGKKHVLRPEHFITTTAMPEKYDAVEFSQGVIYINKEMTEEMQNEGTAREIIRMIQQSRKRSRADQIHTCQNTGGDGPLPRRPKQNLFSTKKFWKK